MICPCRSAEGTEQISFGELFKLNEKISNKCVGILQRARKHRLLHFPGETLWQGADDRVVISLVRKNRWGGGKIGLTHIHCSRDIQVYFQDTRQLLPNSLTGNLWIDVHTGRRRYYNWVTNVREVWPW